MNNQFDYVNAWQPSTAMPTRQLSTANCQLPTANNEITGN